MSAKMDKAVQSMEQHLLALREEIATINEDVIVVQNSLVELFSAISGVPQDQDSWFAHSVGWWGR